MNYRCDTLLFGEILAIITITSIVTSNAMFRKIEESVSPIQINTFRTTVGALTFLLLTALISSFQIVFSFSLTIITLLILGVFFGQIVGDSSYFFAQKNLGTTISMTISITFPFFTFIFSGLLLNTAIPIYFVISAIFIGFGVFIIHKSKSSPIESLDLKEINLTKNNIIAIILCFIAAISWALGIVFTEFVLREIASIYSIGGESSLVANSVRFPFAAIVLILMSFQERKKGSKDIEIDKPSWTRSTWSWLILATFFGTCIGALLYSESTRIVGASFFSIMYTASPIFAIPITWILNKETITPKGFIGVILTLIGVLLIFI